MWLRDLLPDLLPSARIATYSYESHWLKESIDRSLRKYGEQLLNVLLQNRSNEEVGRTVAGILCSLLLKTSIGASTTAGVHWT